MPDAPLFLSEKVESLLVALSAHDRPEGPSGFPASITRRNRHLLRCSQSESLSEWFRRCIAEFCQNDPAACELEKNMGIFAYLDWDEPDILAHASIVVLCADCSLDEYRRNEDGKQRAQYLRLDLDYESFDPFAHSLPHIHATPYSPAVRFELEDANSASIVVDFLELVYRHLQPAQWLNWAKTVWRPFFQRRRRDEFGDLMETVINAARSHDVESLRRFEAELQGMRRAIRERKNEIVDPLRPEKRRFDLTMRPGDRGLVNWVRS